MSVKSRILGPPVPKMPPGLLEIMDGLARDVLKNNPDNIYEFCARHMQTLLEIRDGHAPRPLLTLDQKIENAQKKVRQRAEERRRAYDKIITENNNKQQVIQAVAGTPHSGDDSECFKKETDRNFTDVQSEEKENTEVIQKQETEQVAVLTSELKNEINGTNDELNKVEKENKSKENKIDPEIVTVTDSDKIEKSNLLTENEPKADDTVKDTDAENNVPKEVQPAASSDIIVADNDNVAESLPDVVAKEIEKNNKTTEEIITPGVNNSHLGNEAAELVQNNGATEVKKEIESDSKTTTNEMFSSNIVEKVVASDDNLEGNSHFGIESELIEKQINEPLSDNNLLNGPKTLLNTESNDNLPKQEVDDLNEPEKSPDEQILSVILDSDKHNNVPLQTTENDVILLSELDSIDIVVIESISNEVESGSQQSTDIESVPESAKENDKSNNSSMDLETAAITIQKVFRSFLFKTKTASYDDPTTVDIALLTDDKEKEENEVPNIKDRRHLGISRMDTVLQTVNEEKSLSLSTDDSSTLSSAATIIQAHVRGFLVRNKLNLNKTISSNSLIDSDAPSIPSLEADTDNIKSKTVLNIHIVPEGGHFVSRDESILTSMDLSMDSSPPSSVNLHPLGYDKTERRKQLKREDAIQSGSPPSNNSGKLSEDQDSVKEVLVVEGKAEVGQVSSGKASVEAPDTSEKEEVKVVTESDSNIENPTDSATDEMDVVTPFAEDRSSRESDNSTKLLHSGEFHDIVVPTNVTRTDASVVRGE